MTLVGLWSASAVKEDLRGQKAKLRLYPKGHPVLPDHLVQRVSLRRKDRLASLNPDHQDRRVHLDRRVLKVWRVTKVPKVPKVWRATKAPKVYKALKVSVESQV